MSRNVVKTEKLREFSLVITHTKIQTSLSFSHPTKNAMLSSRKLTRYEVVCVGLPGGSRDKFC